LHVRFTFGKITNAFWTHVRFETNKTFRTFARTMPMTVTWPKIEICKIQDGGGSFVCGSRTACRQGLHDKNCKFLKSKLADGRHFENSKIATSQWKIVRFWWNLVHYIRYWTRWQSRDQKLKFVKFTMAAAAILKIAFLAITHQPIVRFQRNFVCRSRTACRQGLHDKNCKFLKSQMADGRHFENRKIAISQ